MDNFHIDIRSDTQVDLRYALELALRHAPSKKVHSWKVLRVKEILNVGYNKWELDPTAPPTLILLWHPESQSYPFPVPGDMDSMITLVERWLEANEIGPEPDHDGSNKRGFRVFTQEWGHVYGHQYAICGIQPMWAMYGK